MFAATLGLNLLFGIIFLGVGTGYDEQSHFGALCQLAIGGMFGLSQPMLLLFPLERPVFLREYAAGTYTSVPYFLSKLLVEIPKAFITALLIFVASYWLMDLQGNFFVMTSIVALLGLVSASTALLIGASASSVTTAQRFAPAVFVP